VEKPNQYSFLEACRALAPAVRGDSSQQLFYAASSPLRARGKVGTASSPAECLGLTPACAGKSRGRSLGFRCCGAHPCVRGEKTMPPPLSTPTSGLTPACAGKSPPPPSRPKSARAHPCVRGEKWRRCCFGSVRRRLTPACAGKSRPRSTRRLTDAGSPLRARGKDSLTRPNTSAYPGPDSFSRSWL
jgi:hypothetical protein